MGSDRGVDFSRRAIKAARSDLVEALALLSPDRARDGGTAVPARQSSGGTETPVLQPGGTASELSSDISAIGFSWPAATDFHNSARNGITAVTTSYNSIVAQLENLIDLFDQALRNYDGVEHGSEGRSDRVRV